MTTASLGFNSSLLHFDPPQDWHTYLADDFALLPAALDEVWRATIDFDAVFTFAAATVNLTFEGSRVRIFGITSALSAPFTVTIDDSLHHYQPATPALSEPNQLLVDLQDLDRQQHTLTVTSQGTDRQHLALQTFLIDPQSATHFPPASTTVRRSVAPDISPTSELSPDYGASTSYSVDWSSASWPESAQNPAFSTDVPLHVPAAAAPSSTSEQSTSQPSSSTGALNGATTASQQLSSSAVAGLSVGATVGTILVATAVFFFLRYCRRKRDITSNRASTASTDIDFQAPTMTLARPEMRHALTTESAWIGFTLQASSSEDHSTPSDDSPPSTQRIPSSGQASELLPTPISFGALSDSNEGHSSDSSHLRRAASALDPYAKRGARRQLSVRNPDYRFDSMPISVTASVHDSISVRTSTSSIDPGPVRPFARMQGVGESTTNLSGMGTPQEVQDVAFGGHAAKRTSYFD